jgi:hypothetical protein
VADHTTAVPNRKRASAVIFLARGAHLASIDPDDESDAADRLPLQRENVFEQRHAAREIAALGEPRGERLRRIGDDEGGDGEIARRAYPVEPGRDAAGDVPDEARGRFGARGRADRNDAQRHHHKHGGTAGHDITRFRRSQAWCWIRV